MTKKGRPLQRSGGERRLKASARLPAHAKEKIPAPSETVAPSDKQAADPSLEAANPLVDSATLREANERLVIATVRAQMMTEAAEHATAQMRESQQRLSLAMEVAQLDFWEMHLPTGRIIGHGKLFPRLGYEPGEIDLSLEAWGRLIHPDDLPQLEQVLQEQLAGRRQAFRLEIRHRAKSGQWHWILIQAEVIETSPRECPTRLIGVTEDITGRKHLEEGLRRMNEELESRIEDRTIELTQKNEALEESNLELQQFAYIAAHDLQTPLRSITGFSQLLYQGYHNRLDAQADQWLDRLIGASRRMHELIRDVLVYSRVDSRGSNLQPTDFGRLFDEVRATLNETIRQAGAQVTRDDLPVLMADPSQLAQVLQNLIDNGIKYHGADPPKVHVSAEGRGQEWIFSVRDNGIGIAEKHREHIFDIFHRLHSQQAYPGTGIGLAVCRRVIHRHGGRIWVESAPGQGSTFHFTLPHSAP